MDIDAHAVIRAAATKPFGFVPYYPGPGLGGHCIPIDPFYLTWKARQYGVNTRFIELAGEVNAAMPEWVVGKVADALNDRSKAVRGSRILVLGIAYSDPHVPRFPKMRAHAFDLESTALTAEELASQDCVIVATDHDAFDYRLIAAHAPLIVDTRGRYLAAAGNVVKA